MNIKWNWGTKLTLWIIVFMLFIFILVFFSFKNTILLVERDYYPKGLKFQDRIDERNNALAIKDQFLVEQSESFVIISFPEIQADTGTVVFYRHNNNLLDQTVAIKPDTAGKMHFPVNDFRKGKYLVKIHWFEKGKGYFVEKQFFFN